MTLTAPVVTSFPYTGVIADHETNDSYPTIVGSAQPNSTVTVYNGTSVLGTAVVNSSGNWSFTTNPLPDGMIA